MGFHVGQKVVYIARGIFPCWQEMKISISTPVKNGIYTVRELTNFERPGMRLMEIINPKVNSPFGAQEPCWWIAEFRPLEEKKTDISVFLKLLEGQDVRKHVT